LRRAGELATETQRRGENILENNCVGPGFSAWRHDMGNSLTSGHR
jgi:hypothetical protein